MHGSPSPMSREAIAPSRLPSGRVRRRTDETRARIMAAAIVLIAERGVACVTVEQITDRAEVGKGTFFNYFSNKEAVLACFGESQVARLEEAIAAGAVQGTPPERVLRSLIVLAEHPQLTPEL